MGSGRYWFCARYGECEPGAVAGGGRDRQLALHQLRQCPGKGQSQACAAVLAADLSAALAEFLKNQIL
ncbi:MAG: hypothetical protein RLZ81_2931 [Pseudomonadota bacterium]